MLFFTDINIYTSLISEYFEGISDPSEHAGQVDFISDGAVLKVNICRNLLITGSEGHDEKKDGNGTELANFHDSRFFACIR